MSVIREKDAVRPLDGDFTDMQKRAVTSFT